MDYAERGALEKTFDVLIEDESGGFANTDDNDDIDVITGSDDLSEAGRLYAQGILIGMLATMRTFLEEPPEVTPEDADEISQIITRREAELVSRLDSTDSSE